MNKKGRVLIFYDWFYPGFKAGGPIQSLTNLAVALIPEFDIYIVTGSRDLNSPAPYTGVMPNKWNDVHLPRSSEAIKVFYAETKSLNTTAIDRLIDEASPEVVYLNGIFSYGFFLLPLQIIRKAHKNIRIIVAPRGMLKKGALSQKALKKKIYFQYLKLTGLLKYVFWHATSNEEAADINHNFPVNKGVFIAGNIPKPPCSNISFIDKKKGELTLVYLSLINEHKNLLLLLELLQKIDRPIKLDVYGPVIDGVYWSLCQTVINQMPGKVQYKGPVEPANVQEVLSNYHAFVLLTKGENFGHAIYESLSTGRPVITSLLTPWQNLYEKKAGVNVDIEDLNDCIEKVTRFADMEQDQYNNFCHGAHSVATNYYLNLRGKEKHMKLFMEV